MSDEHFEALKRSAKADPTNVQAQELFLGALLRRTDLQRVLLEHVVRLERSLGAAFAPGVEIRETALRFARAFVQPVEPAELAAFLQGEVPSPLSELLVQAALLPATHRPWIDDGYACRDCCREASSSGRPCAWCGGFIISVGHIEGTNPYEFAR